MARTVPVFDPASPNDEDFYEGDFRRLLAVGETLSSATVSADPSTGITVGTPSVVGDDVVRVSLAGGTAGTKYFITFAVETSTGRTLERTTSVTIGTADRPLT